MEAFTIQIAGLVTTVHPLFETTREYCKNYLVQQDADFHVEVTEADLVYEQKMLDLEAREEGLRLRQFTGPFLERAAIQRKIADHLIFHDTLLIHGSTVGVDGAAYLFTAACGTGKSTHTRLWREVFEDCAVMINDDKPFLRIAKDSVIAYGSPWSGKHGLDTNISLPLNGICILRRGSENRIRAIPPEGALPMLRHQTHMPDDPMLQGKVSALVDTLAEKVPLWEMECTKDPEAARIAYAAMSAV